MIAWLQQCGDSCHPPHQPPQRKELYSQRLIPKRLQPHQRVRSLEISQEAEKKEEKKNIKKKENKQQRPKKLSPSYTPFSTSAPS